MSSPLKNRIVGTLIVGAVAIIVLPDLLSGKNYTPDEEFQMTPLRPEVALELRAATFPADFSEQVASAQGSAIYEGIVLDESPTSDAQQGQQNPRSVSASAQDEQATSSATQVAGDAFVIQLGAFRNAETVADFVRLLQAQGFQAFSRTTRNSSGQTLTLLMVGPDLNQQRLVEMLPQLKELTNLEGRVVAYSPAR